MRKTKKHKAGIVSLVGAGPGDTGLMTLKGFRALQTAEAVVYDWLINPELLAWCPNAEKIYAGKHTRESTRKSDGRGCASQDAINRTLARLAKKGLKTVRLKGGDPFVFGRGGEEASYLQKHGIPFEVIPGVSAGHAVPAYAGIPVTDRRYASSVTFVTGHTRDGNEQINLNWKALAALGGTLVSFMGVKNLNSITQSLIRAGLPSKTPVAVIEWGTLAKQRVVEGALGTIARNVKTKKIESPAITVIGQVNSLRKELRWFEKRPLSDKTVLVTRARAQASGLKKMLEEEGARVLEFPVIQIEPPRDFTPLDRALQSLAVFDWVVFTSANAVQSVFDRLRHLGRDARHFASVSIAAVGTATAEALQNQGLTADLVPDTFTSEALVQKLEKSKAIRGKRFLLPRTDIAPEYLKQALTARGGRVTQVVAYRTAAAKGNRKKLGALFDREAIDYVLFTSSSTVRNFFEALPRKKLKRRSRLISIGPVTSATLRQYGMRPDRESREHTVAGLVAALKGESNGAG